MQNLIENTAKHSKKNEEGGEEKMKRPVIKSATDLQRLKLEKLMKNPDKPIIIPETAREKDYMQTVPSFVRNVMGSSAGAGSGEFHVYRHLRRKEYARQKCIHAKSMREQLDEEYQSKLEKNRLEAECKTAKKRAKRLKKKQRAKKPKVAKNDEDQETQNTTEDDDAEDEDDNAQKDDHENKSETNENILQEKKVNDDVVDTSGGICGPTSKEETNMRTKELEPTQNIEMDVQEKCDVDSQNKQLENECSIEIELEENDKKEVNIPT